MTSSTRLPTRWPTRPLSQPAMTWPSPIGVVNGELSVQEDWNTLPVRQMRPVYWTAIVSPFLTTAPVPLISGWICSAVGAVALVLIVTVGPVVLPAFGGATVMFPLPVAAWVPV